MRLLAGVIALTVVATMGAVAAIRQGDSASAVPEAQTVVFARAESRDQSGTLAALAGARRVSTFDELKALVEPGSLLVIDHSAFADIDPRFLRQWLRMGVPIIGLDVPLSDLAEASGYLDTLEEINPMFVASRRLPPAPSGDSYSFVWVATDPARHSGAGQKDMSSGLFSADLGRLSLAARGLVLDPVRGDIVTFGEYDRR